MTELTDPDPFRPSLPPESAVPETARPDPFLGKTIDGRYVIESVLGEGGIGVVYLARHKIIGKAVAIKVLRRDVARDDGMTERFLLEAQAVSSIGSPHIIDISDFGALPDGSRYFVMEYLPGQSLADLIESVHPLPVPRLLSIAKQIATGLGAAHDAGIVHRDIKPDNVILLSRPSATSGGAPVDFVKIFDFGIALVGGRASRLTLTGAIFGSPRYMSPEQASGQQVDRRADIYALGIMLYEMACGKVPFDAENVMIILGQQMNKAPVPLLARVPPPDIPPLLDEIVMKCLSKQVEERYGSMKALIVELERVERELPTLPLGDILAPPAQGSAEVQTMSLAPPTQRDAPDGNHAVSIRLRNPDSVDAGDARSRQRAICPAPSGVGQRSSSLASAEVEREVARVGHRADARSRMGVGSPGSWRRHRRDRLRRDPRSAHQSGRLARGGCITIATAYEARAARLGGPL